MDSKNLGNIAMWIIGIVFLGGGGWFQLNALATAQDKTEVKVERLEDETQEMKTDIAIIKDSVGDTEKEVEETSDKVDDILKILTNIQSRLPND